MHRPLLPIGYLVSDSDGVIDGAITNVALPTIAARIHAQPALSVWIVNA